MVNSPLFIVLERARALGFLGPGPVAPQIEHARKYVAAMKSLGAGSVAEGLRVADLGSGGGLPGLVVAWDLPGVTLQLIDAMERRCAFLVWACVEVGLAGRVSVECARAEEVGHDQGHREVYDVVTARGFGPPAWTAECAGALTKVGGSVLISEPPEERQWPDEGLGRVGLEFAGRHEGLVELRRGGILPGEFPRSQARNKRDPLFVD